MKSLRVAEWGTAGKKRERVARRHTEKLAWQQGHCSSAPCCSSSPPLTCRREERSRFYIFS